MPSVEQIFPLLNAAGIDSAVLSDLSTAHVVADGQILLSRQTVPGVTMEIDEQGDVTIAKIRIARDQQIINPIHLCFSFLMQRGSQHFNIHIKLEAGAKVSFIAHGLFVNVESFSHRMTKTIEIGERAELRFSDSHIHGLSTGIEVKTTNTIKVGKKAGYMADFSLTSGLVGRLDLTESVQADDAAIVELVSRVYGHQLDRINIDERVSLNGRFSRSMIKSRVALEGEVNADIVGATEGRAEGARGHMDCLEIIRDQAVGQSTPIVKVCHPLAKITQLAHGLSTEQATDMIVLGMLR